MKRKKSRPKERRVVLGAQGPEDLRLAEAVGAAVPPCLLCRAAGVVQGIFIPDNEQTRLVVGTPEGKTRVLVYGLCVACWDAGSVEEVTARVQAVIDEQIARLWTRAERSAWS